MVTTEQKCAIMLWSGLGLINWGRTHEGNMQTTDILLDRKIKLFSFLQSFNSLPSPRVPLQSWGCGRIIKKQSPGHSKHVTKCHSNNCSSDFPALEMQAMLPGPQDSPSNVYVIGCNCLQLHINIPFLNFDLENSVILEPLALITALSSLWIWIRCCKASILLWTARWNQMHNKANLSQAA